MNYIKYPKTILTFYSDGNIASKEKIEFEIVVTMLLKWGNMFVVIVKEFEVFREHMFSSTKGHSKVFFHKTISPKNCM